MRVQQATVRLPASVGRLVDGMQGKVQRIKAADSRKAQLQREAEAVFSYFRQTYDKPRSFLTDERRRKIMQALEAQLAATGETAPGELFYALDGARKDEYLRKNGYDWPETILRDRGSIERHAEKVYDYRHGKPHPQVHLYLDVIADATALSQSTALAGVA